MGKPLYSITTIIIITSVTVDVTEVISMIEYFMEMIELVKDCQNSINFNDADEVELHGYEFAVHTRAFKLNLLMSQLVEDYGCTVETQVKYDLYGEGRTECYTISKTGFILTAMRHYTDRTRKDTSNDVKLLNLEVKMNL